MTSDDRGVDPHIERANALYSSGDTEGAIASYRAALAIDPDNARAHYNLGVVLGNRDLPLAVGHYEHAIQSKPGFAKAYTNLGNALLALGRPTDAEARFRSALAIDPHDLHALIPLAGLVEKNGATEEARRLFRQAADRGPEGHYAIGRFRLDAGEYVQAIESYRQVLAVDSGNHNVHYGIAEALRHLGRFDEAAESYRAAIALNPQFAHAVLGLAQVARDQDQPDVAEGIYRQEIEANPGNLHARSALGDLLHKMGKYDDAAALYESIARSDPSFNGVHVNWANCLQKKGDIKDARELYLSVLARNPDDFRALYNLGNLQLLNGELENAKRGFERIPQDSPVYFDAQFGLGMIALMKHEFRAGWGGYEYRFKTHPAPAAAYTSSVPWLNAGDSLKGKRLAVRQEQGIGDQILYSTLLPELLDLGVSAVCEIDPRLVETYRASLPWLEVVSPGDAAVHSCEGQVSLGSLPQLLRSTRSSFDRQPQALLRPAEKRVRHMRTLLRGGKNIGISWRTVQPPSRAFVGGWKSASLSCFAPFAGTGAKLIDLQYGDSEEERAEFDRRFPGLRMDIPGLDRFNDLEGMLAAIEATNLVITTSNVTAHLAGVIGKRTWLVYLRNNPPFHYWVPGQNGRSVWYPSVEICTHPGWTDWNTAFAALAQRLQRDDG